jgi:chromosome segregation ATPase
LPARSNVVGECFRTIDDGIKCQHEKDMMEKQLQRVETDRSRVERDLKQSVVDYSNLEHDLFTCRKEQLDLKQRIETLLREKNTIARSRETLQDRMKRTNYELVLCQQSKKKIESQLNAMTLAVDHIKHQMEAVEKERDKCNLTTLGLQRQVSYRFYLNII